MLITYTIYMLRLNFFLGLNCISLCFKFIIIHYHTSKQREIKFEPRTKLNLNLSRVIVTWVKAEVFVCSFGIRILLKLPRVLWATCSYTTYITKHFLMLSEMDGSESVGVAALSDEGMNPKRIQKLLLGAESYVTITWRDFSPRNKSFSPPL